MKRHACEEGNPDNLNSDQEDYGQINNDDASFINLGKTIMVIREWKPEE